MFTFRILRSRETEKRITKEQADDLLEELKSRIPLDCYVKRSDLGTSKRGFGFLFDYNESKYVIIPLINGEYRDMLLFTREEIGANTKIGEIVFELKEREVVEVKEWTIDSN